jgi:hypothetical protein
MTQIENLEWHMKTYYGKSLSELEISDVPGYWIDKELKIYKGHPLHSCLGCSGPFKATYAFFDEPRINGKFASRTRTWRSLYSSCEIHLDEN